MTDTDVVSPARSSTPAKVKTRRFRRFLIVTHRWLSLILGLVLLVITTSGAILVYKPEIERALNSGAYDASGGTVSTTIPDARQAVQDAHPDFDALSVWFEHGVYRVTDYESSYTVDPATGEILGRVDPEPEWILFLDNLHECWLSCVDYPGYWALMEKTIPGTQHLYLGFDGEQVTIGGMTLGIFALLLIFLSASGLWLWFPRRGKRNGKWKASVSVRWKRGRFARDTDLHNVVGLIAIPLLAMWAITGASYEFHFVEKGWYAALPGSQLTGDDPLSAKAPKHTPDITEEEAVAAAVELHPDMDLVNVDVPAQGDRFGAYTMYFSDGYDPWAESQYPGEIGVFVDRHTGVAQDYYGFPDQATAQTIFEDFNYPVHSGYFVNGWWKSIWFVLGMAPILLAITGVSTWLVRNKTRRNRKKAAKAGAARPLVPDEVSEVLVDDPESAPDLV